MSNQPGDGEGQTMMDEQVVKQTWPKAHAWHSFMDDRWHVNESTADGNPVIGTGLTEDGAWRHAAAKLRKPVAEVVTQGETSECTGDFGCPHCYDLAKLETTDSSAAPKMDIAAVFGVEPYGESDTLQYACGLLDVIKSEWGEAWSEHDQKTRAGLSQIIQDREWICTNCGRDAKLHPILSEEGDCYDPK